MNAPVPPGFTGEALFSAAHLEHARRAAAGGVPMLEAHESECGLPPEVFARALAQALHLEYASMDLLHGMTPVFDRLPYAEAAQRGCVLARGADGALALVFADPFDDTLRPWIEYRVHAPLRWMVAHRADIAAYLARHEEGMRAMDGMVVEAGAAADQSDGREDLSLQSISADTSPVVKLVHSTLYDALKIGASDIHLETAPDGLAIKYRVDGVLAQVGSAPGLDVAEQVISRIKVMSELDISERRTPQDGRFRLSMRGRRIDFRVSIMPSIHGEDAVLRILDKQALTDAAHGLRLDLLKFDEERLAVIRRLCSEPYGMFLVTGPTGSGKTTTLYAALAELNTPERKIITVEDPVEYRLPGINQVQVHEKIDLTFGRVLRSALRQDPDVILVGEMRDQETAETGLRAAMTGHLVLSTLHTNDAVTTPIRLLDMGAPRYMVALSLQMVLAQRLVRLVCESCSETYTLLPGEHEWLSQVLGAKTDNYRYVKGKGCSHCNGTGFLGRTGVYEMLEMSKAVVEAANQEDPAQFIEVATREIGEHTLRVHATQLVVDGKTTVDEAMRISNEFEDAA